MVHCMMGNDACCVLAGGVSVCSDKHDAEHRPAFHKVSVVDVGTIFVPRLRDSS